MYLAEYMGKELGLPTEEAYARRHESDEMRNKWYDGANRLREHDPTYLARQALAYGQITGGLRDKFEMQSCIDSRLFDLVIWVRNPRKEENDPTMKFGPELADFILLNDGDIPHLRSKVERLVKFANIGKNI